MTTTTTNDVAATINSITAHFGNDLREKRIAVWGLTSQSDIHDACESPAMEVVDWLLSQGARVCVHATDVVSECPDTNGENVEFESGRYDAIRNADALVVVSDDEQYRAVDAGWLRWNLAQPVIFDTVNCLTSDSLKYGDFAYYGSQPNTTPEVFSIFDCAPVNETTREEYAFPVAA